MSGRDQVFRRSTSIQDDSARGEAHNDVLQGESDASQPLDTQTDDSEARSHFSTIVANYICSQHVEPRVKLHGPIEASFPILHAYIDVVRRTHATLDVLLESRVDDYWNVDGGRDPSEP